MKVRPIDKSRPSNRRCCNCIHFPKRVPIPPKQRRMMPLSNGSTIYRFDTCPTAGGKAINYWNCCKYFQWNPAKQYVEGDE